MLLYTATTRVGHAVIYCHYQSGSYFHLLPLPEWVILPLTATAKRTITATYCHNQKAPLLPLTATTSKDHYCHYQSATTRMDHTAYWLVRTPLPTCISHWVFFCGWYCQSNHWWNYLGYYVAIECRKPDRAYTLSLGSGISSSFQTH